MAKKKINENSNLNVVNTLDSMTSIITSIITNIKDESYKVLTKSKELSYKDKMKLRNNIYIAVSVLKALDNMYVHENEYILDNDTFARASIILKEQNHKKLATLLKEGRNDSIDACHELSFEIMRELDKLDYAFSTQSISIETTEDGRDKYSIVNIDKAKVTDKLIHNIKKVIRTRNYIKTEQNKIAQSKSTTAYYSTAELSERLDEVLDVYKGVEFKSVFTPNIIRYIVETLTIRFNILHNPENTKQQIASQLREFNKILNSMGTVNFVNSGSELFDARYDYTLLLHIYHKLEHALSTNIHNKKVIILKELDAIIYKLEKHTNKCMSTFKKCLNKTNLKELEEKLKGYQFIDDEDIEEEPTVEQSSAPEVIDTVNDNGIDIEVLDTISIDNINVASSVDTKQPTPKPVSKPTTVNSRKFRTKTVENTDKELPEFYENVDIEDTSKDSNLNDIFNTIQSLKNTDASSINPTVEDINETVSENTASTTPDTPKTKYKISTVDSISERLHKLNQLLNKK